MTTLRDVAERAGVSAMTVSNVVNGRTGKVSSATLKRVRAVIDELGYVPNAQARALAGSSSRLVALVYGISSRPRGRPPQNRESPPVNNRHHGRYRIAA